MSLRRNSIPSPMLPPFTVDSCGRAARCPGWPPLRGLHEVSIFVERTGDAAQTLGVTDELLTDQVFVALKRDVPRLRLSQNKASLPFIHIEVTAIKTVEPTIMACVRLSVVRPVYF